MPLQGSRRSISIGAMLSAVGLCYLVAPQPLVANENFEDRLDDVYEPAEQVAEHTPVSKVFMPIPVVNPTIGTGGALALMLLYPLDQGSPPSATAFGSCGTTMPSPIVRSSHYRRSPAPRPTTHRSTTSACSAPARTCADTKAASTGTAICCPRRSNIDGASAGDSASWPSADSGRSQRNRLDSISATRSIRSEAGSDFSHPRSTV
jgi:hypothetical protein